jgi:CPA2 family monovalent cation:H+ antiporter-2
VHDILLQIAIYLAAAVIAVPIAARLGFGSVLGYLAAGVVIGPTLGLVGAETEDLQHFAEYGVVLMLFLIGLEMRPQALWEMRHRLFGLGGLQVGVTLALIMLCTIAAAGLPWRQALAVGIILCLSSTAIVMQTLAEKKLSRTEGGRASFAVLLFQDMAAIPLLALIPLLAPFGAPAGGEEAPLEHVAGWMKALLVVGVVAAVIAAGTFLTRPLYRFIAMARLPEIQTAAALLLVVAISLALGLVNLSPALGSFLAGVVLANSEYRHELESDIAPFKGLLLGLFFITVGAGVNLGLLASDALRIVGLTLLLMLAKAAVLYPLAGLFGLHGRARLLFTLGLAQAGEFGFFLLAFATQTRVLPADVAQYTLLVISLSMFLTPALFLIYETLRARMIEGGPGRSEDEIDEPGTVIIAGVGRFGQVVNRMLTGLGHKTVVLDSDPVTIDRIRTFGVRGFFGEVDRPELLAAAGIAEARAIVIAIDDAEKAVRLTRYVRRRYPDVKVIARARDRHHVYQLYAAGTPHSVRETFDSAVRAGKYALEALGYDDAEVERIAEVFFEHDRHMLRQLAEVWDPNVPPEKNPAYVRRAREQSAEIAAVLRGGLRTSERAAE